ncbi:tRNA-dihydrouridine synthase [Neptuniibacter sp.]|uniref:tRNA dihydrouridine synthase n=1 Tax=Neptuniibacter sp. TaxID=1962643 RepID=UPI002630ABA6|nr:tRNA-dihydrouridine synthase [Neptuniibacter sp.]MCP4597081.1 tRNA dihydrouridine(16) synthase DusC [Neptuniibacter sp.]
MKIILAPMEGVVDYTMRDLLTQVGGIDHCVTEFLRVSDSVLPAKVFRRLCPELHNGGKTPAGTPVILQLLGSDPSVLAGNARKGAKLGAPGIDLNFGCPAKTVNRSKGGAVLLDAPELVHEIVKAVREAVPEEVPVSAKMRLGNKDKSLALENAHAIADAGADSMAVHARTKLEGYKPPAHWEWIARIREAVNIPVVANGEVWNWEDYLRCREVSGCDDVMIGRGLIAKPDLAKVIKHHQLNETVSSLNWEHVLKLVEQYLVQIERDIAAKYVHGRLKQWLHHLQREYDEAGVVFEKVKKLREPSQLRVALNQQF